MTQANLETYYNIYKNAINSGGLDAATTINYNNQITKVRLALQFYYDIADIDSTFPAL